MSAASVLRWTLVAPMIAVALHHVARMVASLPMVTADAGVLGPHRPEMRMPGMRMAADTPMSGSGFPLFLILLAATAGVTVWTAVTTAGSARRHRALLQVVFSRLR